MMARMTGFQRRILSDVLSIPTAPFHEQKVMAYVARFSLKHGFRLRQDGGGNLFVRHKRGRARQPIVFTAHMDHPGFEVLRCRNGVAEVGIMGGVRPDFFRKARVIIFTPGGLVKGRVLGAAGKKWMKKDVFRVKVTRKVGAGDFGCYDLVGARFRNRKVYTRSADNLAGTAFLLNLLYELKKRKAKADVTILLTRAEEVGFVGCIYAAEDGRLRSKTPIVVVETSDAAAGNVVINGGPVIRVGDKQSGFAPEMDAWMHMVADSVAKKGRGFRFQRALLAGGRCEAAAYLLKGYSVGGIAFPLGNYHNNGKNNYAAEYVGEEDYVNMLEFLVGLSTAPKVGAAFKRKKKELWQDYAEWKGRLTRQG